MSPVADLLRSSSCPAPLLRNPGRRALLDALAISGNAASYPPGVCDLLVVGGAGPAGLAASVYGASDGMATTLAEDTALGGQAGTSSRIENYLGFPAGLSGEELATRGRCRRRSSASASSWPPKAASLSFEDGVHRSHSITARPFRPGRSSSQRAHSTTGFPWTPWPSSRASGPPQLVQLLEDHRREQDQERAKAGEHWVETRRVFTDRFGRAVKPNSDYHAWKALLKRAGVRETRLHDARHPSWA
jgi:hypothetical protein